MQVELDEKVKKDRKVHLIYTFKNPNVLIFYKIVYFFLCMISVNKFILELQSYLKQIFEMFIMAAVLNIPTDFRGKNVVISVERRHVLANLLLDLILTIKPIHIQVISPDLQLAASFFSLSSSRKADNLTSHLSAAC